MNSMTKGLLFLSCCSVCMSIYMSVDTILFEKIAEPTLFYVKKGNTQYIEKLRVMLLVQCTFPFVVLSACEFMSVAVILLTKIPEQALEGRKTMLKQYPISFYVLGTFSTFTVGIGNL